MLLVSFIFFAILGLILFWMFSARAVPNNRPINRPAPNPKACDCSQVMDGKTALYTKTYKNSTFPKFTGDNSAFCSMRLPDYGTSDNCNSCCCKTACNQTHDPGIEAKCTKQCEKYMPKEDPKPSKSDTKTK
ncbi:MAG: hypothetical protein FJZ59_02945 [Chlamydiae bacterium]|nr:hypothetical protein [Chlamydiota bacterium]